MLGQSLVFSCSRLYVRARYVVWRRTVRARGDGGHHNRADQAWQSVVEHVIVNTSCFRLSTTEIQRTLTVPAGRRLGAFPSDGNEVALRTRLLRGLPMRVLANWPNYIAAVVVLASSPGVGHRPLPRLQSARQGSAVRCCCCSHRIIRDRCSGGFHRGSRQGKMSFTCCAEMNLASLPLGAAVLRVMSFFIGGSTDGKGDFPWRTRQPG